MMDQVPIIDRKELPISYVKNIIPQVRDLIFSLCFIKTNLVSKRASNKMSLDTAQFGLTRLSNMSMLLVCLCMKIWTI